MFRIIGVAVVMLLSIASPVFAAEATAASNAIAIDTVWMLIAAFLVFFMQAGFALVETGFTQAKNACNIIIKKTYYAAKHCHTI